MEILTTFNLLLLTGVFLLYKWVNYKMNYWKRRGLLVPDTSSTKTLFQILFAKNSFADRVLILYRDLKSKGVQHGGAYITLVPLYVAMDLNIIKSIMQVDFQHFVDRGVFMDEKNDPISAHLFSLTGSKWKILRNKLSPTFTSGKMKMMFGTLVDCTKGLHKLMDKTNGKEVDIKDVLGRFTTDIIGSCAFGIECNSLEDPKSIFRQKGREFFDADLKQNMKNFSSLFVPQIMRAFKITLIPRDISSFFINLVKDTVEYREKNNVIRKDFMQLLIQLKNEGKLVDDEKMEAEKINEDENRITMDEIAAQAFVFFQAGFETSSTTMTFCLYELARNKDIQEKLRKEIIQTLDRHGGKITYENVHEMVYLDQVINETLRKYPPLPNLNRVCTKEYKVPGTDLVLEKGMQVIIPVFGIHRDPEYYPDPDKFDPERFTEENKRNRHQFSFLPFGEGPRICIGLRFGLMQTKVGLIALLSKYEFSVNKKTIEPLQFKGTSFIMTTKGDIWLDFKKISESR
ncbi:probable cytochrome P450 6a14 [Harmonia axyridis]|uniref:probable cytochrome P450 6a14 n=1 Tax=Harmonia axyridis TaxID=115357 RepID=UPI001E2781F2|nr:probable cytochrome P450 6a14 [Harmonia axyridis]XP_045460601.1 probable cytochrome P450 6a14 [Harmonia axyridis]